MFSGEQLTVLGRFREELTTTVKFAGNRGTEQVDIQQEIAFDTSQETQRIVLRIFDARGKLVRKLVNEVVAGGNFMALWDCRNDAGSALAAGTYFDVLTSGTSRQTARIPLTK